MAVGGRGPGAAMVGRVQRMGNLQQQKEEEHFFVSVSQRLLGRRRRRKERRTRPLSGPVLGGLPAGATSANVYTLNLWATGEDRTLTKRQKGTNERLEGWQEAERTTGC